MAKIHRFIIGGIILLALTKIPYLKQQTYDIAGLFGLIIVGSLAGLLAYGIFGARKRIDGYSSDATKTGADNNIAVAKTYRIAGAALIIIFALIGVSIISRWHNIKYTTSNPIMDYLAALVLIITPFIMNPPLFIGIILLWRADRNESPNKKSIWGKAIKIYLVLTAITIVLSLLLMWRGYPTKPTLQLAPTKNQTTIKDQSGMDAQKELEAVIQKYPDFNDYREDTKRILETTPTAITIEEAYLKAKANRQNSGQIAPGADPKDPLGLFKK